MASSWRTPGGGRAMVSRQLPWSSHLEGEICRWHRMRRLSAPGAAAAWRTPRDTPLSAMDTLGARGGVVPYDELPDVYSDAAPRLPPPQPALLFFVWFCLF